METETKEVRQQPDLEHKDRPLETGVKENRQAEREE